MATQQSRSAARLMMAPAVILLLGWMLVPSDMTLWFSFKKYLPLRGGDQGWGRVRQLRSLRQFQFILAVGATQR
jgi:sorbitol/mannitol transport system permease protein